MVLPILICSLLASTHAEEESALFEKLAKRYGVLSSLKIGAHAGGERGAYISSPVQEGEPVLVVPTPLLLASRFENEEEPGILLTKQLLAALFDDKAVSSGQLTMKQQHFWQEWAAMLPKRGTLSIPVTLPLPVLSELQDGMLLREVKARQARINSSLSDTLAASLMSHAELTELRYWAAALCMSRAFNIGKSMLMVPFLDMVNHNDSPNCKISAQRGKKGKITKVGLIALRDLLPGEEATYSYFDPMPNRYIFGIHGFAPEASRHDRLQLPTNFAPLAYNAWRQTMHANRGRWAEAEPLCEAVEFSMPLTDSLRQDSKAELAAANAIEQWLRETAERDFSTSLSDDEVELNSLLSQTIGGTSGGPTAVRRAILGYRIQRKRLWQVALDIIAAHKLFHNGHKEDKLGQEKQKQDL